MKKRDDLTKDTPEAPEGGLSRRRFMGAAAIAGVGVQRLAGQDAETVLGLLPQAQLHPVHVLH